MSRILVTGAAGFIGSNVTAHFLDNGDEVVAVDDEYLGTPANVPDAAEYRECDVTEDQLPVDGCDAVVHLAALSSRQMHEDDPQRGCRVNVEGFINTVEQAVDAGVDDIVYASTSSIYGSNEEPSPVEMNVTASTAYEASKLARERYAEYYREMHGVRMVGLRFFSVYQGMQAREGHKDGYANIISQFAEKIASGESPVVFGDGTQTRDFVHVSDVVRAVEAALDSHDAVGVYNVGTGERHSFNEVVEVINEKLDTNVEPTYRENPLDNYVHHTCADSSAFREATGWHPEIDFDEGISRVCRPYRD